MKTKTEFSENSKQKKNLLGFSENSKYMIINKKPKINEKENYFDEVLLNLLGKSGVEQQSREIMNGFPQHYDVIFVTQKRTHIRISEPEFSY
uniref:Uncharacterized protein n=1 Tax=Onchocerca volvulus TaxID=6282 RepID=A0A8R1TYQ7_ONCVO